MAVAYHHRLIASGPSDEIKEFRRAVSHQVFRKTKLKKMAGRHEFVPISFAAMYAKCPTLVRIDPNLPYDPYDISAWPKRVLPDGRVELRYQFHLRNIEFSAYLVPFSRLFLQLEFRLVIFCLDDSEIDSYLIRNGRARKYKLPDARSESHWDDARARFGIAGDDIYDDDDARRFAEEGMLEEALDHWDRPGKRRAVAIGPRTQRRNWWNRPAMRNLRFEQELSMAEISQQMADEAAAQRRSQKPRA